MFKQRFNRLHALRFKHFTRNGYALFSCLGKEVLIGTLSVVTLTYAKANGISTRQVLAVDSLGHEEVKIDEVVVTGSRAPLTASQSARIVSVITRDDIDRAPAETVNDLLKLAIGVDVRQRGGYGVQTDISIDGGTSDQITILLNGMPLSSPQTGHNAADFPVNLADIERIEILEGSSSRVFGSSAFNGAVNIVTRKDSKSGASVAVEGGSFGTFGTEGRVAAATGRIVNTVSGAYRQSDGGTLHSDFKRRQLYYTGHLGSRVADAQWQFGISSQDFGANTFDSAKFNNQFEATRRYMASATATLRPLGSDVLTLVPQAYWHRDYDHYQLIRGKDGAANGENYRRTDVYGGGLTANVRWLLGTSSLGADIRREHIVSTAYGDELPESEWKPIDGTDRSYSRLGNRTNTSLFLEHNVIVGGLTVSAGVMANRNTCLDGDFRLYPGVDVSYRPDDHWKIYASWNKALRVPTYTDLYAKNSVQVGDLTLSPERNSTFKVGTRYRTQGLSTVVSAFYAHGTDIIDWVYETAESKTYHALNIGRLNNMGASAEAALNLTEIVHDPIVTRVKVAYAYIHQTHDTDRQIYGSLYALEYLRHKFTVQLDHRIVSHLSAQWNLRWQQRRNGYHPYCKVDAKLMWSTPHYNIYVKADNLTAHRYYDIGGVRQPGLWVMAGMSVTL